MNIYYVYQYLRENGTPYYIGMGSKKRAYSNSRTTPKPLDKNRIQIIACKLSRYEAFLLETKLIKFYGRIDLETGILRNRTDGGEGSQKVTNKVAWNKGKTQSKEHNLKIAKALTGVPKSESHRINLKSTHNRPQKGTHWWNNGIDELMAVVQPDGYVLGRIKTPSKFINLKFRARVN